MANPMRPTPPRHRRPVYLPFPLTRPAKAPRRSWRTAWKPALIAGLFVLAVRLLAHVWGA